MEKPHQTKFGLQVAYLVLSWSYFPYWKNENVQQTSSSIPGGKNDNQQSFVPPNKTMNIN
jgi:hypothetical protein